MDNFNLFVTLMITDVNTFLMAEPMIYFVALTIMAFLFRLIFMICGLKFR